MLNDPMDEPQTDSRTMLETGLGSGVESLTLLVGNSWTVVFDDEGNRSSPANSVIWYETVFDTTVVAANGITDCSLTR